MSAEYQFRSAKIVFLQKYMPAEYQFRSAKIVFLQKYMLAEYQFRSAKIVFLHSSFMYFCKNTIFALLLYVGITRLC